MIDKAKKGVDNRKSDGSVSHSEGVFKLKERSLELPQEALQRASDKLKKAFQRTPRSLFDKGLPTPYIKGEDQSKSLLHFNYDGKNLMYFTPTEFINLTLPSGKIATRKRLQRADLSPIFYDYNIWSHDSTKVLVSQNCLEIKYHENKKAYIFDTVTGEYTDLFKKFEERYNTSRLEGPTVCCFNPAFNDQLILYYKKQTRAPSRYGPGAYEGGIYTWNWKTNQKRLIAKDKHKRFTQKVITQSGYIIIFHVLKFPGKTKTEEFITVYRAKGLKKLVSFKKIPDLESNFRNEFNDSQWFTKISEAQVGKICLNYKNCNFLVLDLSERRLSGNLMTELESKSISGVLPASLVRDNNIIGENVMKEI